MVVGIRCEVERSRVGEEGAGAGGAGRNAWGGAGCVSEGCCFLKGADGAGGGGGGRCLWA